MNILTTALSWLIFLALFIGSIFVWEHIGSILDGGEFLFVLLMLMCLFIWFSRRDKDGFYKLFKDIHQSNLDDIKEQQLEEQIDQTDVKEQIKTSLETAALVSLILYLLICSVLFVFAPNLGLVNWLILLSFIPAMLILGFLKDKITSTIKDIHQSNLADIEKQELEEQEVAVNK